MDKYEPFLVVNWEHEPKFSQHYHISGICSIFCVYISLFQIEYIFFRVRVTNLLYCELEENFTEHNVTLLMIKTGVPGIKIVEGPHKTCLNL